MREYLQIGFLKTCAMYNLTKKKKCQASINALFHSHKVVRVLIVVKCGVRK